MFDGISCGRVALERAGIPVDVYYASEIDKYAIQVAQKNYPDTIQLGDVTQIDFTQYRGKIDLIIGGSPCQGFSLAGKQLNFNDPRSKLFFDFVRAIREIQPRYFLLENVKMKQEYQDIISDQLGVQPIEINSALVSAQNRKRLYWTNIPGVCQPNDKGILLKDVLLDGAITEREKSLALTATMGKKTINDYFKESRGQFVDITRQIMTETNLAHVQRAFGSKARNITGNDKCNTLTASMGTGGGNIPYLMDGKYYRRLSPIECERLQTLPDNYTAGISDSQRYKALGNGWTVDVIAHIFKGLTPQEPVGPVQTFLF